MGCETKQKGEVTEAAVLAELVKLGFAVLQPFGDNQPYDLVVEQGGNFFRIQCKTGILKEGVINFRTVSTLPRFKGGYDYRTYEGKIDFFAVCCPSVSGVFLVPVDEVAKSVATLRVDIPKNGQRKNMKFAEDYVLNELSFGS